MAVGANLKFRTQLRLKQQFWKYLTRSATGGQNRLGRPRRGKYPTFLVKTTGGAPVSNAVNDAPDRAGQICLEPGSQACYLCTQFTSTSNHTWQVME